MVYIMKVCPVCQSFHSKRSVFCDTKCWHKDHYERTKCIKPVYKNCVKCGIERKKRTKNRMTCDPCYHREYKTRMSSAVREKRLNTARNYHRKKVGIPLDTPSLKGPHGKGFVNKNGYRILCKKGHPNCLNKHGALGEHTFVMSNHIGRPLMKGESVHHKNGIRDDNRIENLELWHRGHPPGQRVDEKLTWCQELLEKYGYKVENQGMNGMGG